MPINFGAFAQRPVNPMEVTNGLMAQDAARQQQAHNALLMQTGQLDLQEKTAGIARQGQLRNALLALGSNATDDDRIAALKGTATPEGFTQADALQKAILERRKTDAEVGNKTADTAGKQLKQRIDAHDFHVQQLGAINDPAAAQAWVESGVKSGVFQPEQVPTDPAGFAKWKQSTLMGGMDASKQMHVQQQALDESGRMQRNDADNKTRVQTTGMSNATSLKVANIHEGGQNARAADARTAQYKIAGIDPQTGNFVGGADAGASSMVDLVGTGKLSIATALARTPPGQKERFSAELQKRYPDYDPTALATQTAAAKAFTTGKEAGLMRSIGTAVKHLDMLDGLTEALNNGNIQIINQIGNKFNEATGKPAPTNFNAAKDIVGQEVVKSIVVNGGSMQERLEAANAIKAAQSPAQLRGVIKTYKTIMEAQHESLLQQRDAAGLPRSTLPDYTEKKAKPAAAAYSDAEKERRYQEWKAKQK